MLFNRREIFKFLGIGTLGAFLPNKVWSKTKSPHKRELWKGYENFRPDESFQATDFFDMIKMDIDVAEKFPLDEKTKTYFVPRHNSVGAHIENVDYLYVPIYEIGASAPTDKEVYESIIKKINLDAARLLFVSGIENANAVIYTNTEKELATQLVGYKIFQFGPYAVGVKKNDYLVMPVREEIQIYQDHPRIGSSYYGWCAIGLAVLSNKDIVIGQVRS